MPDWPQRFNLTCETTLVIKRNARILGGIKIRVKGNISAAAASRSVRADFILE